MIDVYDVAVLGTVARELDHPARCGDDGLTGLGDEVHALVHRELAGERVDAHAKTRGVVGPGDGQHRREELLLDRLLEHLGLKHAQQVGAVFHLPGKRRQLLVEFLHRQVLPGEGAGLGAPEPGRLVHPEFLRLDPGDRRQPFPEGIQPGELRLHFSELDRHCVQVLLDEHAGLLRLPL